LVEGSGGALAPYSRRGLIIDIVKELKIPVIIVAENKLGAINHTLLTIEALKRRKIKILGIFYNTLPKPKTGGPANTATRRAKKLLQLIQKDNPIFTRLYQKTRYNIVNIFVN
jgi:dethiobiotin synthetase